MTMLGAYVGNETSNLTSYESWLGRSLDTILSFINQSSWSAFESSIPWGLDLWSRSGRPVVWGVPLVVDGSSLAQAAAGSFDHHYRSAAEAIAASRSDDGPIYVRIGWEFNGSWMPWAAAGHEAEFIGAFRRAADIFDDVSDRFKIVWDVNIGGGNIDPATAYPGDAYVDVVGTDLYYNTLWDTRDPQTAFAFSVSRPYGLQWVADFAQAHGKPMALSEWGVESDSAGPFVQNVAGWIEDHDMLYANYWESNAGGFSGELRTGHHQNLARDFLQTFGDAPKDDTLVLQVSGDSYAGDPQFIVSVDGRQVGGIQTARASHAAGQHDTITLRGDFGDDPSLVTVEFLNDAWGGRAGLDRNLYVERLTVNGETFAGGSAVNTAGVNTANVAVMGGNGTATFHLDPEDDDLDGTLVLKVSADSYEGDPEFVVRVDGRQVGGIQAARASHAAGAQDTITLRGDFDDDASIVTVEFLNDAWGGRTGLDRNLYVEQLIVNGETFSGGSAVNTAGANTANVAVMGSNGTATFHLDPADGDDTLLLKVSADSYDGDPQFLVRIDGRQVGGVHAANASHASGARDTFTFQGDFDDLGSIAIEFINDAWGGRTGLDRNLYVEHLSLNGEGFSRSTALNTAGANAENAAILGRNGTATFHLTLDEPGAWLL